MEQTSAPQPTPPPYTPPYSATPNPALIEEGKNTTELLKSTGVSSASIYEILIQKGIDHSDAIKIIESTLPGGDLSKKEGRSDMIIGGLWIAGGLVLTIGSYMMVSESGGRYLITYGPIIYGVIRFFQGVAKM